MFPVVFLNNVWSTLRKDLLDDVYIFRMNENMVVEDWIVLVRT